MEALTLLGPTMGSDVLSISDQALSDRLQFVQEVIDVAAYLCTDLRERGTLIHFSDWLWELGKCLAMSSKAFSICK